MVLQLPHRLRRHRNNCIQSYAILGRAHDTRSQRQFHFISRSNDDKVFGVAAVLGMKLHDEYLCWPSQKLSPPHTRLYGPDLPKLGKTFEIICKPGQLV
jgi:hypothetical protein